MMRLRILTGILTGILFCARATYSNAGEGGGYIEGEAGMFLPIESSVYGSLVGPSATVTYNPGEVLAAVGGYRFSSGLRAEGELNFRHLSTDRLLSTQGDSAVYSDVRTYGFMTNLYYDFLTRTAVTPYVGAGVGLAVVDFARGSSNGATVWSADRDVSLAYQVIGGFLVRIADDTSLDFVYHHYALPRLHFDTLSAQFRGPTLSIGVRHWF